MILFRGLKNAQKLGWASARRFTAAVTTEMTQ
jgi:hypothetical protein